MKKIFSDYFWDTWTKAVCQDFIAAWDGILYIQNDILLYLYRSYVADEDTCLILNSKSTTMKTMISLFKSFTKKV